MGGALTQLAAYGAQDVYLTGNPQMAYRREGFKSNSFTLKHAAIFASIVSLAIIFFYMKRNRLPLVLLVAIGVIFTLIQY